MDSNNQNNVNLQINVESFRCMDDEQIKQAFNKKILPDVLDTIRKDNSRESDCSVCNPWSYSVF